MTTRTMGLAVAIAGLLASGAAPAAGQQRWLDRPAALLAQAEGEHRAHRMDAALELYEQVARVQEERDELPAVALRRIATIHLAAGRHMRAANALDRLARRAEWLGYPEVQASALLEAAVLHQQEGSRAGALERVRRLEPLLGSPHMTPETAARIRSRLRGGRTAWR